MVKRRRLPLIGRDPHESERASTPLELLYDLTFVVAIGQAAHHLAAETFAGHTAMALVGFAMAMFAILNAWIDFSWFASSYDTDDWLYRLLVMVQMSGVVVLAIGTGPLFESLIEPGHRLEIRMIVVGYVIMRVAQVGLWSRVAAGSPQYGASARREVVLISGTQALWIAMAIWQPRLVPGLICFVLLGVLELLAPVLSQGEANGSPWHPHHIAERYGLLAIIALGEGVVGTVASSQAALGGSLGWDTDAVVLVICGIGLTFGIWWNYFSVPFGDLLHLRPRRGYLFGYGHYPIFIAIAAVGAGLGLASLAEQARLGSSDHASASGSSPSGGAEHGISNLGVLAAIAIPVICVIVGLAVLEALMLDGIAGTQVIGVSAGVVLALIGLAVAHDSLSLGLVLVTAASFAPVISYELSSHRFQTERIEALGWARSAQGET